MLNDMRSRHYKLLVAGQVIKAPVPSGDTTDRRADCNTPFGQLTFGPVTFNDNCDGTITAGVRTSHAAGAGCDSVFTRTWTATDGCGNTRTVTQAITVKYDSQAPVPSGDTTDKTAACNSGLTQRPFCVKMAACATALLGIASSKIGVHMTFAEGVDTYLIISRLRLIGVSDPTKRSTRHRLKLTFAVAQTC